MHSKGVSRSSGEAWLGPTSQRAMVSRHLLRAVQCPMCSSIWLMLKVSSHTRHLTVSSKVFTVESNDFVRLNPSWSLFLGEVGEAPGEALPPTAVAGLASVGAVGRA